jgi:predicted nucleic acid-binding protein
VTTPSEFRLSLVDSSGWIEYLTDGRKADLFAPFLEVEEFLLVPSIVFYEVYKKLLAVSEANPAIRTAPWRFVSHALRATNAVFDADIALKAVEVSRKYKLAMADAIIFSTAQFHNANLITSDSHFTGLPGVTLF